MQRKSNLKKYRETLRALSIILPIALWASIVRYQESDCVGFGAGGTLCGGSAKTWLIILAFLTIISIISFFMSYKKEE